MTDQDATETAAWIQETYEVPVGSILVQRCIDTAARDNSYHPVRNYLDSLQWDGDPRLDMWLTDYFGVVV